MHLERLHRILRLSVIVLAVGFAAQIAINTYLYAPPRITAAWAYDPRDLGEAKGLAQHIVEGQVLRVDRADDLIMKADGEPGGVDRVAVEVVHMRVDGALKGQPPKEIQVFHTAGMPVTNLSPPPMSQAPPKPPDALEPPLQIVPFTGNRVNVHDDPHYQVGQRYLLFLREGPKLNLKGQPVATFSLLSPTTRFEVTKGNHLVPAVSEGLGFHFRGQNLLNFREMLMKTQEITPTEGKIPGQLLLPGHPITTPGLTPGMPQGGPPGGVAPRGVEGEAGAVGDMEIPREGPAPGR